MFFVIFLPLVYAFIFAKFNVIWIEWKEHLLIEFLFVLFISFPLDGQYQQHSYGIAIASYDNFWDLLSIISNGDAWSRECSK